MFLSWPGRALPSTSWRKSWRTSWRTSWRMAVKYDVDARVKPAHDGSGLMFPGVHPVAVDGGFAERAGGFQPVQALAQHETLAVGAHLDRHLLAVLEHAGGEFRDPRRHQGRAPFHRHVDFVEREFLDSHHGAASLARAARMTKSVT